MEWESVVLPTPRIHDGTCGPIGPPPLRVFILHTSFITATRTIQIELSPEHGTTETYINSSLQKSERSSFTLQPKSISSTFTYKKLILLIPICLRM